MGSRTEDIITQPMQAMHCSGSGLTQLVRSASESKSQMQERWWPGMSLWRVTNPSYLMMWPDRSLRVNSKAGARGKCATADIRLIDLSRASVGCYSTSVSIPRPIAMSHAIPMLGAWCGHSPGFRPCSMQVNVGDAHTATLQQARGPWYRFLSVRRGAPSCIGHHRDPHLMPRHCVSIWAVSQKGYCLRPRVQRWTVVFTDYRNCC